MTQLDKEDYHLFHYSLVYTEDLQPKLRQIPLIGIRRQQKLLMMDERQMHQKYYELFN